MRTLSDNTRFRRLACSLMALALLLATSQYLSHFHVGQPTAHAGAASLDDGGHTASEHCSLCVQFDRLPAPPVPATTPTARFRLIALLEARRLEARALDVVPLWPPSRGPPASIA